MLHTGVVEMNLSGVSYSAQGYCLIDHRVAVACNPDVIHLNFLNLFFSSGMI